MNVIFILVDTLRADHTSLLGYHRQTTPFLEELARESVVFEHARTQAACTFPSVNSMLTSRYAFDFYRSKDGFMGIPESYPTAAELLKRHGYATAAVSASPIVRATPSRFNPAGGFDRGFETFDEQCLWSKAECVNSRAIEVVSGLEEPYFLYLHYMDPHATYQPPPEHERAFSGGPYDGPEFIASGKVQPIAEMLYKNGPPLEYDDRDIQHLVDLYDDEILYFDTMLRALVAQLRESGQLDRSLLILTSDHGEEFLEHGHIEHCRGVWNTLTHVPLLIRYPGAFGGTRVSSAVQGIDLLPTILGVLGLRADDADLEGTNLAPLVVHGEDQTRFAFSDQSRYRSADDGEFHLILDGVTGDVSLFDVVRDPLEINDCFSPSHPRTNRLSTELEDWLTKTGQRVRFDLALAASKEQEENLRALGYLE
jgi:arylsulfatase